MCSLILLAVGYLVHATTDPDVLMALGEIAPTISKAEHLLFKNEEEGEGRGKRDSLLEYLLQFRAIQTDMFRMASSLMYAETCTEDYLERVLVSLGGFVQYRISQVRHAVVAIAADEKIAEMYRSDLELLYPVMDELDKGVHGNRRLKLLQSDQLVTGLFQTARTLRARLDERIADLELLQAPVPFIDFIDSESTSALEDYIDHLLTVLATLDRRLFVLNIRVLNKSDILDVKNDIRTLLVNPIDDIIVRREIPRSANPIARAVAKRQIKHREFIKLSAEFATVADSALEGEEFVCAWTKAYQLGERILHNLDEPAAFACCTT